MEYTVFCHGSQTSGRCDLRVDEDLSNDKGVTVDGDADSTEFPHHTLIIGLSTARARGVDVDVQCDECEEQAYISRNPLNASQ